MCTITKEEPVLQIAEEDIIVYKHCHQINSNFIVSLWRDYYYELNKVYKTILNPFDICGNAYESGQGFYSYKEKSGFYIRNCIFIIPKGSKYYLCKSMYDGEWIYHSDQIKYVGLL